MRCMSISTENEGSEIIPVSSGDMCWKDAAVRVIAKFIAKDSKFRLKKCRKIKASGAMRCGL